MKVDPISTHVMVRSEKEDSELSNGINISYYSLTGRVLRIVALVLRFIQDVESAVSKSQLNKDSIVSALDIQNAECLTIKLIQSKAFKSELAYLFISRR